MQRFSLHDAPAAGFDAPFEMLEACHERVRRSLSVLQRLAEHVRAKGADDQAASAARDVLRYFDLAAPQHHEDEERHVFPRLLAGDDAEVIRAVERLQADHVQMAQRWLPVRTRLQGWAGGEGGLGEGDARAIEDFVSIYGEHLRLEEQFVNPAARRGVGAAELAAMGQEMGARRRG